MLDSGLRAKLCARRLLRLLDRLAGLPACRGCGCTDHAACEGGCYWVEPDLCSACVDEGVGVRVEVDGVAYLPRREVLR